MEEIWTKNEDQDIKDLEIWGLSGKLGVGKDYVARHYLLPSLDSIDSSKKSLLLGYADCLKLLCMVKYRLDFDQVFVNKNQSSRRFLQEEGQLMKDKFGNTVWVNLMESLIKMHFQRGIRRIIITDVRFPQEYDLIHTLGGKVIYVHAPSRNLKQSKEEDLNMEQTQHVSETSLDKQQFDFNINNEPGQNVALQIANILHT